MSVKNLYAFYEKKIFTEIIINANVSFCFHGDGAEEFILGGKITTKQLHYFL